LISQNKFWVSLLVLISLYGLSLCAPAVAFDGQKVECPACKSSLIDNWEYPQGWELLWDPTNPEEISESSSVNIGVIGGVPSYQWSVSGTGFWLSSDQTQGLSNTLNADDIACGSATITVTDNFGDKVTGYVRCENGQWSLVGNTCSYPGEAESMEHLYPTLNYRFYRVVGKYRQMTVYSCYTSCSSGGYNYTCISCNGNSPCWPWTDQCSDSSECVKLNCAWINSAVPLKCDVDQDCLTCVGSGDGSGNYQNIACYNYIESKLYEWVCP